MKDLIVRNIKKHMSKKVIFSIVVFISVFVFWFVDPGTSSKEAFINANVSTVISPVPGTIYYQSDIFPGQTIVMDQVLAAVKSNEANAQITQLINNRQTLNYQIAGLTQQIIGNQNRLNIYMNQHSQYQQESKKQRILENDYSTANHEQLRNELLSISKQTEFSEKQLNYFKVLYSKGHLSKVEFEREKSGTEVLQATRKAKSAELKKRLLDMSAAASGLQLSGPRTLDAPQQNARDLTLTIEDLKQTKVELQAQLRTAEDNLAEIHRQLAGQQSVNIKSHFSGVVWSVDSQNISELQSGSPILQIIDCDTRWVDAFFDESDASNIQPGRKVSIRLSANDAMHQTQVWSGIIQSVRAGTGRVSVGESIVMPPPEIARRQLPVKVVTARIKVEWKDKSDPLVFCMVGRSVNVVL